MIETVLHAQVRVANFLSKEEMHKLCVQDVAQLRIYINELMHTVIHALCGFAAWVVLMVTSWELGLVNLGVCLAAICTISVLDAFLVSKRTEENSDSGEFHGIWEDIHAGKKDGEAEVSAMVARVRHEETHDLGVLTSAGGALNTLVYATPVIVLFTGGVLVKEGRLPEHEIAYCFFYCTTRRAARCSSWPASRGSCGPRRTPWTPSGRRCGCSPSCTPWRRPWRSGARRSRS